MINFTSILTTIKGATLATKIGLGVGAVAIVAGGTVGVVAIVNTNHPQEKPEVIANNSNTDNSPSNQESTQVEETKDNNQKTEQANSQQKPTTNNSQTTTKKPGNDTLTSNNQPANGSSTTKPSTPTPKPSQPSEPTQPSKKPDYNLNDRYVAGYVTLAFSKQDEAGEWYVAEQKQFFGVAKFTGSTADLYIAVMPQYIAYAKAHGYPYEGGGMGAVGLTWDDVVREGTALDEAKCAQYGLSCGRW